MNPHDLPLPGAEFFLTDAVEAAQRLLGCYLLSETPHDSPGGAPVITGGRIVETEAYTAGDPASHSYSGRSARNGSMFAAGGTLYVYLIYGVHHCLNVVVGPEGTGEAVLLRSIEPIWGVKEMARRRGIALRVERKERLHPYETPEGRQLRGIADGPGKIAQALSVSGAEDGTSLVSGPVRLLLPKEPLSAERIVATHRIGITKAARNYWRFLDRDSDLLSRKLRASATRPE